MNELRVWVVLVPALRSDALANEKKYEFWVWVVLVPALCLDALTKRGKIRMNELWVRVVLVPALCSDALTNNENADERVMSVSCRGASIVLGCLDKREKIRMNELWVWVVLVPSLCSDALANEENTDERVMSVSCPGACFVLGCLYFCIYIYIYIYIYILYIYIYILCTNIVRKIALKLA